MKCTRIWLRNSFRGVNIINKDIVLLACDTLTWPDICPHQILSNYLKQYGSYGLYKILVSGEVST